MIDILQRIAIDILKEQLAGIEYANLFDQADIENKGDRAINVGEYHFLAKLNISLLSSGSYTTSDNEIDQAKQRTARHPKDKVAILSSGGGNIGGYKSYHDYRRGEVLKRFPDHKFLLLSQSTRFYFDDADHYSLTFCQAQYSKYKNITFMLRDQFSFDFINENFPTIHTVLAPDMAFGIGRVPQYYGPMYDVIWLHRSDPENPVTGSMSPAFPPGISFIVADYLDTWPSPKSDDFLDHTYLVTHNGLIFLQRGKVVVTDRLHGHILAALLNKPTVIFDNRIKKISNLWNTWTRGLERVRMVNNVEDAVKNAMCLLELYGNIVQDAVPSGNVISEMFQTSQE